MAMEHEPGSEWDQLGEPARKAVESMIEGARRQGKRVERPYGTGDVHAYPMKGGKIAWGVNGLMKNLFRGVVRFTNGDEK